MFKKLLMLLLLPLATQAIAFSSDDDEFLHPDEAFKPSLSVKDGNIEARWKIADGYYLYRDKFRVASETPAVVLGDPQLPPSETKSDPNFGDVEVYHHDVKLTVPVTSGGGDTAIKVTYQGCADSGLCYPPQKKTLNIALAAAVIEKQTEQHTEQQTENQTQPAPLKVPALGGKSLSDELGLGFGGFDDDILPVNEAFKLGSIVENGNNVKLIWDIADGVYMYADKIKLSVKGDAQLGDYQLPDPEIIRGLTPEGEEGDIAVYLGRLSVDVPLLRSAKEAASITLHTGYQGCADQGICYPPQKVALQLDLPPVDKVDEIGGKPVASVQQDKPQPLVVDATPAATPSAAANAAACAENQGASTFSGKGFWAIVALFFLIGLGLSLTPCVFPMIPILSGIITGHSGKMTPSKGFFLSLIYVLSMAVTYTLAGIAAAKFGGNIQVALQHPVALVIFALLFVALAFSMFGFYELQLPSRLQSKLTDVSNHQKQGSLVGVAIMGFLSALIVGPCVAPPLAAALAYIGTTGDVALGGTALFVMAMGMGVPLLLIGVSAGKLLPKAGGWMDTVKAVFGVVMLGIAISMLERLTPTYLPAYVPMILWGLLLVVSAIYMGVLEPLGKAATGGRKYWKGIGAGLLIYGAVILIGASMGNSDPLQPLTSVEKVQFKKITTVNELQSELRQAKNQGRGVLIDFYADWCVYCKTMEKIVFPDPQVQKGMQGLLLLKADVTSNQELLNHFGLVAPPTILLFDRNGEEMCDYRLIGDITVSQLLEQLKRAFP
ncbi:MAG: protein-disulfide reductase DsbD [Pseudomonadota bacterium]|nr:protein-disulfide reductase DsbD [Pseudomonadota bacterium]